MVVLLLVGRGYWIRAGREERALQAQARGGVVQPRFVSALNLGAQMIELMDEQLVLHADEQQRQTDREKGADHDAPAE